MNPNTMQFSWKGQMNQNFHFFSPNWVTKPIFFQIPLLTLKSFFIICPLGARCSWIVFKIANIAMFVLPVIDNWIYDVIFSHGQLASSSRCANQQILLRFVGLFEDYRLYSIQLLEALKAEPTNLKKYSTPTVYTKRVSSSLPRPYPWPVFVERR